MITYLFFKLALTNFNIPFLGTKKQLLLQQAQKSFSKNSAIKSDASGAI